MNPDKSIYIEKVIFNKVDFDQLLAILQSQSDKIDRLEKKIDSITDRPSNELTIDWQSIKNVSEKFDIPIRRLRHWISTERIKKHKVGRSVFINIKEVRSLLADEPKDVIKPRISQRK